MPAPSEHFNTEQCNFFYLIYMCNGVSLSLSQSNTINFDVYENYDNKIFLAHFSIFQSAGAGSKKYFLSLKLCIAYFYEHTQLFRTSRKKIENSGKTIRPNIDVCNKCKGQFI